jgi:hypothetical protein
VAVDAAGDVFIADSGDKQVVELVSNTTAALPSPQTGTTATIVSDALTNLLPGTTYYDRVVASGPGGMVVGSASSFTTLLLPTITVSAGPFTYDGNAHAASATAETAGGSAVSGSLTLTYYTGPSASGAGSSTAPTVAGTYTVVAHFTSTDANYADADSEPLTFSIGHAASTTTTVGVSPFTYDGTTHAGGSGTVTGR